MDDPAACNPPDGSDRDRRLAQLRQALADVSGERWLLAWDGVHTEQGEVVCWGAASRGALPRLRFIAAADPATVRMLLDELAQARDALAKGGAAAGRRRLTEVKG